MEQGLSWQRLLQNWSDAELRFALQDTMDPAPNATNLRRLGVLEVDPACIVCGKPATLHHVLHGCRSSPMTVHLAAQLCFVRHPSQAEHFLGTAQPTACHAATV